MKSLIPEAFIPNAVINPPDLFTKTKFLDTTDLVLNAVIKSFDLFADNDSSWWYDPSSRISNEAAATSVTLPKIAKGKNKFLNVIVNACVFVLFSCVLSNCAPVANLGIKHPSLEGRPKLAEGQSGAVLIDKAVRNIPCRDVNIYLI